MRIVPMARVVVKAAVVHADMLYMIQLDDLIIVLQAVLSSPEVIIVTVAVLLYMSFINWIVRYRKRPPRPARKKAPVAVAEKKSEVQEDEDERDGPDDEEDEAPPVKKKRR